MIYYLEIIDNLLLEQEGYFTYLCRDKYVSKLRSRPKTTDLFLMLVFWVDFKALLKDVSFAFIASSKRLSSLASGPYMYILPLWEGI